jgi:hypothetical protein
MMDGKWTGLSIAALRGTKVVCTRASCRVAVSRVPHMGETPSAPLLFFPLKAVHFPVRNTRMPITPHPSKKKVGDLPWSGRGVMRPTAWSSVQWNLDIGVVRSCQLRQESKSIL